MTPNNNVSESRIRKEDTKKISRGYRSHRLREIMAILSKHEITKGLTPVKLRLIIEDLGPTFVKLGQILSMRQDILPVEYCSELEKLRSDVAPMPFSVVKREVEAAYGQKLREVFQEFDEVPLGSASIAQVHRAVLTTGEEVVVKVQRPDIYEVMAVDMALLDRATALIKLTGATGTAIDFEVVLDEMWVTAKQEMDFLMEAHNAETFASNNEGIKYVTSPRIFHHYTTSKVLMMEYLSGIDIDHTDELTRQGYDLREIAEKLAENYIKQVIDDAFFHADPHPGNIRIHGGQIGWIDLGMMGSLSGRDRELFKEAITAVATQNVESLKTIVLTIGVHSGHVNHARLYADIDDMLATYGTMDIGEWNISEIIQQTLQIANFHHITMPKGITMLMRGYLTVESVVAMLDPKANLVQVMMRHMLSTRSANMDWRQTAGELGRHAYGAALTAMDLPQYAADLLKTVLRGQAKVNLELTGSEEPLERVDRMVNRIINAVIIAALLIGSSFIATTNMEPQIMGIPALGFIGYFVSVILGGITLIGIYRSQRKPKK